MLGKRQCCYACFQVLVLKDAQENQSAFLSRHIEKCSFWTKTVLVEVGKKKYNVKGQTTPFSLSLALREYIAKQCVIMMKTLFSCPCFPRAVVP